MSTTSSLLVGWVGTGVMGLPMCRHVLNASYRVTVFNRSRRKTLPLFEAGALWADSPRAVAEQSNVVFTMVGFPQDVRQVYLGPDGILAGARAGSVLVDMTTTEPALARELYSAGQAAGVSVVDAPVSGGDVGARNATLSVMVGGDADAVERARPILEVMSKTIVHQGGAGAGQHAKMCNQLVIAGTMIGVCESLVYGRRAGLDLEKLLLSIRGGAAGCWSLDNLAPRVMRRDFEPGFFVEHFVKDLGIALEESRRMGLNLPGLALARELYMKTRDLGFGRKGTHALVLAIEAING